MKFVELVEQHVQVFLEETVIVRVVFDFCVLDEQPVPTCRIYKNIILKYNRFDPLNIYQINLV